MFANLMSLLTAVGDKGNSVYDEKIVAGDREFLKLADTCHDGDGYTLLTRAIFSRSFLCASTLLKKGVDPNTVDGCGRAPVDLVRGYPGMLVMLVKHGLYVGPGLFEATLPYLDDEAAKCVIQHAIGFDPNRAFADGRSPLAHAVCHGLASTVKALVKKGAHVNAIDDKCRTAAHVAAYKFKECGKPFDKVLFALVEVNADVGRVDSFGNTPWGIVQKAVIGM